MPQENHYDVIIIGTGAGGGTLAYRLAPSGKRILLLERGDYVPREKDNWSSKSVNAKGKYQTKETWRDKDPRRTPRAARRASERPGPPARRCWSNPTPGRPRSGCAPPALTSSPPA